LYFSLLVYEFYFNSYSTYTYTSIFQSRDSILSFAPFQPVVDHSRHGPSNPYQRRFSIQTDRQGHMYDLRVINTIPNHLANTPAMRFLRLPFMLVLILLKPSWNPIQANGPHSRSGTADQLNLNQLSRAQHRQQPKDAFCTNFVSGRTTPLNHHHCHHPRPRPCLSSSCISSPPFRCLSTHPSIAS